MVSRLSLRAPCSNCPWLVSSSSLPEPFFIFRKAPLGGVVNWDLLRHDDGDGCICGNGRSVVFRRHEHEGISLRSAPALSHTRRRCGGRALPHFSIRIGDISTGRQRRPSRYSSRGEVCAIVFNSRSRCAIHHRCHWLSFYSGPARGLAISPFILAARSVFICWIHGSSSNRSQYYPSQEPEDRPDSTDSIRGSSICKIGGATSEDANPRSDGRTACSHVAGNGYYILPRSGQNEFRDYIRQSR